MGTRISELKNELEFFYDFYRGVVGAMAPPDFGRSFNPISTRGRGADYAHPIILAPPDFQTFLRPCFIVL